MSYYALLAFPAIGLGLLAIRIWYQGKPFRRPDVNINGKVVIVTGCNTGIGKETVLELAKRGGRIYMACRDYKRCEEARLDIISESGNPNVFNRHLDLSSLASVRKFVQEFKTEESKLHILINNAAIGCDRSLTVDGYEIQFATNHLGPFLLTILLLDRLRSSAPSRIVMVSSRAHLSAHINREDLMNEKSYSGVGVYSQTKLANVLFSRELSKRLAGTSVTVNSLHPGVVKTEIFRNMTWWMKTLVWPVLLVAKTPKAGAQTTLTVAIDPAYEQVSGRYFSDSAIVQEGKTARDDETAEWLWNKSVELSGLKADEMKLISD